MPKEVIYKCLSFNFVLSDNPSLYNTLLCELAKSKHYHFLILILETAANIQPATIHVICRYMALTGSSRRRDAANTLLQRALPDNLDFLTESFFQLLYWVSYFVCSPINNLIIT